MAATPKDDLREDLAGRRVVLIVGAGVSVAATGGAPTASWTGLLADGVAYCESLLGPSLPAGWADRRRDQLTHGDTEEIISVAEDITRRLARLDPGDPVKYDFALCHKRMSGDCLGRRDAVVCAPCGLRSICARWRSVRRG